MTALSDRLTPSENMDGTYQSARDRVSIHSLSVSRFRSYHAVRLDVDHRPIVLTGANGAGKTNLLEALSFFAPGRGLRGAKLGEVVRAFGGANEDETKSWAVAIALRTADGLINLGTGVTAAAEGRRAVHIDGEPAKSAAVFSQYLGVVWLTPAMDRLFADGPGARRRFIDRLIVTIDADHAGRGAAYEQAYRQRLRLLRDGDGDEKWFSALEDTMARHGVALAAARHDFLSQINRELEAAVGAFPAAHLALEGELDGWLAKMPAIDAEDAVRKSLHDERRGNPDVGAGPHRSELNVKMIAPGHPSDGQRASLCSTGEQKALLISMILAHARLQRDRRGHVPILLLDEIAAHLDPDRRASLFEEILKLGAQAWMTGTDANLFKELGDSSQFFSVKNGTLEPSRCPM